MNIQWGGEERALKPEMELLTLLSAMFAAVCAHVCSRLNISIEKCKVPSFSGVVTSAVAYQQQQLSTVAIYPLYLLVDCVSPPALIPLSLIFFCHRHICFLCELFLLAVSASMTTTEITSTTQKLQLIISCICFLLGNVCSLHSFSLFCRWSFYLPTYLLSSVQ